MIIQFIGCGNMGEIILNKVISQGMSVKNIYVKTKTQESEEKITHTYGVNIGLNSDADIVFLAIKPQQFLEMNDFIFPKNSLIISIMAGVTIDNINKKWSNKNIIRCMPNTAISNGNGVVGYFFSSNIEEKKMKFFINIFSKFGYILKLDNEDKINKITALSGSGPAYFYFLTQLLKQKALKFGFSEIEAVSIANNTFIGSAKLLENSSLSVEDLRKQITSKGGTTQKAIESFENNGFIDNFFDGIEKAYDRAKDLNG
ncbi:pyrroline-5-carboxylate reductase [Candidatus Gracilibacteria bacterium]|nr:pyrroline-5-carboxylate reductase [Candidatus Gracilibacteria bacterium]NUJ99246.1 pyrroline-5-carboxylate reductase [Candidatus Gracilibacteria bacterium]